MTAIEQKRPSSLSFQDQYAQVLCPKEMEDIFKKTVTHNITQVAKLENLQNVENANTPKWLPSKATLTVFLFYTGLVALGIGIGSLLPVCGINGIPLAASIPSLVVGIGLSSILPVLCIGSKINPQGKIAAFFKEFQRKDDAFFLGSNLNDLTFALTLIVLSYVSSCPIFQGILNYALGALLIASGVYQLKTSIAEYCAAKQVGDKEKIARQLLNILNSLIIIFLGVTSCPGWFTNKWVIYANLINGAISLIVAFYLFERYSLPNLSKLIKIDKNNHQDILDYLQNTLNLSQKEKEEIEKKYQNYTKEQIIKWININSKYFDDDQKTAYKKLINDLNKQTTEIKLNEIRKLIIKEEIKKEIDNKIETFRGLVNQNTYTQVLKIMNSLEDFNQESLSQLLSDIKKDVYLKTGAEIIKVAMFAGFLAIPTANRLKKLSDKGYTLGMAILSFISFIINSFPRLRNIPPYMDKDFLDINSEHFKATTKKPIHSYCPKKSPPQKKIHIRFPCFNIPQFARITF